MAQSLVHDEDVDGPSEGLTRTYDNLGRASPGCASPGCAFSSRASPGRVFPGRASPSTRDNGSLEEFSPGPLGTPAHSTSPASDSLVSSAELIPKAFLMLRRSD
ncbi:hypothetical protein CRG98_006619 [Punica granatum]|uniref:Uncharacterized protein n=1 Tax=Punica granatum TaxID=22663 RepID=A0A2I0KWU5_PUNGR|nr:hypothetical protein CRG98_006619 [Punica granatum]